MNHIWYKEKDFRDGILYISLLDCYVYRGIVHLMFSERKKFRQRAKHYIIFKEN